MAEGDIKGRARLLLGPGDLSRRDRRKLGRALMPELAELASAGDSEASNILGGIELEVEGNPKRARQWFESSAAAGSAVGLRCLGWLYAEGQGGDRDQAKATALMVQSAEAGDVIAMQKVAGWFRDGSSGEVDLVQAARWFFAMLGKGNGDGIHEVFQFASRMSFEEIREAARLAGDVGWGESMIAVLRNQQSKGQ
ncbi:tetratricopeptide repeat protein [Streptacidiphilus albus]|uniref:tetratricopeptide repeat protein n=1 Tax=Streptacidiphilus albus TaxID=105425 RepID=UPI001364C686|nr:SEL1-like repeat protein [Streptacidiphilus albus]